MTIALGIALILGLTAATGYFVAQEFAYVAVDRDALRRLAEDGDAAAGRALKVTAKLSFALSAAQFGITVTALLVGYVSEPLVGEGLADLLSADWSYATRLSVSVLIVMVFSTVVQMVFGELAPKNLAIARTVGVARALSRSTLVYLAVIGPIVRWFDSSSTWLLRKVGIEPVEELGQGATAEDLSRIIDESHAGGLLDDDLSGVLEGGLRFRDLEAGDVMTPRVRVETISHAATVSDLQELLAGGHSRFPVTGADRDDIVGVAGIADILAVAPELRATTTIGGVVDPPTVVPTSAPLPRVLDLIRSQHRQLAVVVDEHGGFAGVVTFEDIAEEVVGEILDEDDVEVPGVHEVGDSVWEAPGHLRLDELETATAIELVSFDEYTTLSGLVLERLGRTARPGDVVDVGGQRDEADEHPVGAAPRSESRPLDRVGHDSRHESGHDSDHEPHHDTTRDHRPVAVPIRLTVVEVARHVPSLVRVEVVPLLQELEELDSVEPADSGEESR